MQFRVGVMIFATLLITGILVAMFGKLPSWFQGKYTVYVILEEAPGVTVYTPVRKSGIRIGQVTKVEFIRGKFVKGEFQKDDQGADYVQVSLEIDKDRQLRHNEICRVSATLLGDSSLQFVRSDDPNAPDTLIGNKDVIRGVEQKEPVQVIANLQNQLTTAIEKVGATSDELGAASRKIREMLEKNDDRIGNVIIQADKTLVSIQKAADMANEMIDDPKLREQFKETFAAMPQMMKDTHVTIKRMGTTMDIVDKNLRNLEGFTQPLGEKGSEVIERLDQGAKKLDILMGEMVKFGKALNNQEGTLGQLVNNPELYQHLNRAAKNIDEMSRQLRPILDDARIITDKAARHPGVFIRDAIKPGPGIK
jgi:phospholipid/cholesterol/gamma-HCH transport system substrate-binding protein